MASVKVSSKRQMIIPKRIREALDIRSGTELVVELLPNRAFKVTVRPTELVEQVRRLAGSLAHRAMRMTPEEEKAALMEAMRADDERILRSRQRRR